MPTYSPIPEAPLGALNQWTFILAFLMPVIVSTVNQSHWSSQIKSWVAGATCLLAAGVQLYLQGELTPGNFIVSGLSVWALALVFFAHFWKKGTLIQQIEKATDLAPVPHEPLGEMRVPDAASAAPETSPDALPSALLQHAATNYALNALNQSGASNSNPDTPPADPDTAVPSGAQ